MDNQNQASSEVESRGQFAALLELTASMREKLIAGDIEGFANLVERRGEVIAAIGQRSPATQDERECLARTAELSAQVTEYAGLAWRRVVGDLQQLKDGKQAAAAYFRSMVRADPEDNSKFIDRVK